MNVTLAPFDDPDVRNAEEFVEKILFGYGDDGNDNPIASSIKFAIDPQPTHRYDPEMAKSLLRKAGLSSLEVDLSASDAAFGGAVDAAVLFQNSAAQAGIKINVVREPNDAYWGQCLAQEAVPGELLARTAHCRLDADLCLRS